MHYSPPPFRRAPSCCLLVLFAPSTIYTTDLVSRDPETFKPLHVVNMTIKDSPEESAAAAGDVLNICKTVNRPCFFYAKRETPSSTIICDKSDHKVKLFTAIGTERDGNKLPRDGEGGFSCRNRCGLSWKSLTVVATKSTAPTIIT